MTPPLIRIPASIGNLGPGFDTLGLAADACRIERHPDNAAAAMFGCLTSCTVAYRREHVPCTVRVQRVRQ
jgi:homoserine kinase